jgi:putative ABC transport system substrate-binding protein
VRRRLFLLAPVAALAVSSVRAQPTARSYRVAWILMAEPSPVSDSVLEVFRRQLAAMGYVEGRNLVIDQHWAHGKTEDLPAIAARVVAQKPDVIIASTTPAVRAAAQATREIPVVMSNVSDPVGSGLVKSLARPGANVTGPTHISADISPKLLELVRALVPKAGLVAVLMASDNPAVASAYERLKAAGTGTHLEMVPIRIASVYDLRTAFPRAVEARVQAAIVLSDPFMIYHRVELAALAGRSGLPVVYQFREHVEVGGLVSLGADLKGNGLLVAEYVDRLLRGAKPADLPIQEPLGVALVVNLRAANEQGFRIPQDILSRADEVIR